MKRRGRPSLARLTLLATLLVVSFSAMAATPEDRCDALKLKAAANAAKRQLVCHAKAIAKDGRSTASAFKKLLTSTPATGTRLRQRDLARRRAPATSRIASTRS